jgi:hypothetical protein
MLFSFAGATIIGSRRICPKILGSTFGVMRLPIRSGLRAKALRLARGAIRRAAPASGFRRSI